MLRRDDQQRLVHAVQLDVGDGFEREPHAGGQRAGAARELIADGARRLGREDGDRALPAVEAALDVQRLPAARLLVLADAGAELPRLAEGRHVHLARPPPADVADHELQGAADGGVGARPLAEDVAPAVESDLVADGSVDDEERADEVGGGQHPVQVEGVGAGRFDRGDDHRQVPGPAAGHDGVDGDLLHRGRGQVGRHVGHHLAGLPRRAGQHPRHPFLGRRHHRQAVGQPLLVEELERIEVGGQADPPGGQPGSVAPGRQPPGDVRIVDLRSAARPRLGQRFAGAREHRGRAAAAAGGQLDQRQQIRSDEALAARQHLRVPAGQHQGRHRVETVLLRNGQLGVERQREREPVAPAERGGARGVVLRHAQHAQAGSGQRPMRPLDQRRGQVARRAVVLEEEEQRRGRGRTVRPEPAGVARRVAQRERGRLRSGSGKRGHDAAQYRTGFRRRTGTSGRQSAPPGRAAAPSWLEYMRSPITHAMPEVTVHVPDDVLAAARKCAMEQNRSLSSWVTGLIRQATTTEEWPESFVDLLQCGSADLAEPDDPSPEDVATIRRRA